MNRKSWDTPLIVAILTSYVCFCISTFVGADFWIRLFSPLTAMLTGITILACLSRMGRFWVPSFLLSLGIFAYMLADWIWLISDYILHTDKFENAISFIFLIPNYFFGASVAVYFIQKLKGRELYQFLINTFTLTVIGFVGLRKVLVYLGSYSYLDQSALIRIYLYFTINLFILIMIGHMVYMIGTESGFRGTNTMILGIFGYILLDIPYTYAQAMGRNPENEYSNLIYMFCMMLMAHGIYHQVHHHHVFRLKTHEYNEKSDKRIRMLVLGSIIAAIILLILGFFDRNEAVYIILALLAYWITTATFQNGALNEQLLKQQDILTGLYNRRYSSVVLSESVRRAKEQGTKFAVFCVDLNNFKPVNDTYGHDMGDRVLKEFGSRMLALPSSYTAFRTGGDEFMLVRDDLQGSREGVEESAKELQDLFHTPISLDTYVFNLSGSIGVAVYPDDTEETERLIRYADAAMYSVKHSANKDNYRIFDMTLVETVEKHKALEDMLKNSVPSRDFVLHYQPRMDSASGKLCAAEVFPRLKGESTYTAADILPIAEEVGLMNRLGNWIIETSLHQLKTWRNTYNLDMSVSLNLSPLQLLDADFLANLKGSVERNGLSPSMVHLDISNEAIMGASITAKETLRSLHDYGFELSLNDFGGDDINLNHILTCGFSAIHLSPSLIRRADKEDNANILIKSIIGLANDMNISAYAVGIETGEQGEKLKNMGAKALQGYYFGRPVEAKEFEDEYIKKEADA